MGCDYLIEEDEVEVEVVDYKSGEVVDKLRIDRDEFESEEMALNIRGAKWR